MNRRAALAAAGVALTTPLPGCLSLGSGDDDGQSDTPAGGEATFDLEFAEREGDSSTHVRERIVVRNVSGERQNVRGYTLAYSSGYEYVFGGRLTLEPGSTVAVVTRGGRDGVADSDPPKYYRDADLPELVLADGAETVRLLDRDDEVVVEATYAPE